MEDNNPDKNVLLDAGGKGQEKEDVDISKRAVVLLVVLTLAISVLGTLTVLYELNGKIFTKEPTSSTGSVKFSIIQNSEVSKTPSVSTMTGQVVLSVLEPPETGKVIGK